ncbi:unnamed protein product, partial [Rotaria sp. Silwood1]
MGRELIIGIMTFFQKALKCDFDGHCEINTNNYH